MHKQKKLRVAFLLPIFNAELLISRTLDSLLKQTYKEFKIYVINNGSTDNSESILRKYEAIDSRINIYNLDKPNLTRSLCFGIRMIKEELILRIDAGDISDKDRVLKTINFMLNNPNCAISYTDWYSELSNKLKFFKLPQKIDKEEFLFFNKLAHSTLCLRKSILTNLNFDYSGIGEIYNYEGPSQDLLLLSIAIFVFNLEIAKVPNTSTKLIKGVSESISIIQKKEQARIASIIFLINNIKIFSQEKNIKIKIKSLIGIFINIIRLLKYKKSVSNIWDLCKYLLTKDINNEYIYQKTLLLK